jgi:hypothetical protein
LVLSFSPIFTAPHQTLYTQSEQPRREVLKEPRNNLEHEAEVFGHSLPKKLLISSFRPLELMYRPVTKLTSENKNNKSKLMDKKRNFHSNLIQSRRALAAFITFSSIFFSPYYRLNNKPAPSTSTRMTTTFRRALRSPKRPAHRVYAAHIAKHGKKKTPEREKKKTFNFNFKIMIKSVARFFLHTAPWCMQAWTRYSSVFVSFRLFLPHTSEQDASE